jgi:formimidoylglutamate deiminase
METLHRYRCDHALLPDGWADDVVLSFGAAGDLVDVARGESGTGLPTMGRWVLPGMPNLHSHAFQRAMAGSAEHAMGADDDFWSWREAMYAVAGRVDPEGLQAIAAQLYAEMLCAGYTAVCEFQYVHHQPDATPYAPATAMSEALLAAAAETGIGLTLLPALYQVGGFDQRSLAPRQRRFGQSVEAFATLVDALRPARGAQVEIGIALHSLRAVPAESMSQVWTSGMADVGPVHIHVAEQIGEVDECLQARGARPVAWLLANAPVDPRWCLVHATHMSGTERVALAATGAVAGLCPTTEANLGDGLFPLREWLDVGGGFGIGSDSHVSVSAVEELRWLEYGQRLRQLKRTIAVDRRVPSVGEFLWRGAVAGGAQACGRRIGALAPGHRADFIVLDDAAIEFAGRDLGRVLDTWVFASNRPLVRETWVGGRRVVEGGHHVDGLRLATRMRRAVPQGL